VVLERLDDPDLLTHPARVVADRSLEGPGRELEPVEELRSPRRRPAGQLPEVVEQPLPAERVVQRDPAGQVPDPAPDRDTVAHDVEPQHLARAGGRVEEAEQEPDRRRLAGAVRAEECEDLALANRDRQVLEREDVAARTATDPPGDPLG